MAYFSSLLSAFTPFALLAVGLHFGILLRFFPFLHPLRVLRRLFFSENGRLNPSSLRATAMALAGTIGVGNMVGVAFAILMGGAGAVFWMWVCALAAMLLKYAEITLALDSRPSTGAGGTPASFAAAGHPGLGGLFALLCLGNTFLLGGAVQAGAVRDAFADDFGTPAVLVGLVLLLLALPALLGGGRRISRVTARLVPFMCLLYLVAALAVIFVHAGELPSVFSRIWSGAFEGSAAGGGLFGFLTSRAVREGAARGLMSNEGGCGTAPLAHATAEVREPAAQGLFGIFEVAVDTLLICTLTALAILTAFPELPSGLGGMALVRAAFSSALGPLGGHLVTVSLALFAYATVLCEGFYGEACLSYLTERKSARYAFCALFCLSLLLGALCPSGAVWQATDILLSVMTLLNLALLLSRSRRILILTRRAGLLAEKKEK